MLRLTIKMWVMIDFKIYILIECALPQACKAMHGILT